LTLAFEEIRQYGAISIQVMRRLRSALFDLAEALTVPERRLALERYIEHLNLTVEHHIKPLLLWICIKDSQHLWEEGAGRQKAKKVWRLNEYGWKIRSFFEERVLRRRDLAGKHRAGQASQAGAPEDGRHR